MRPDKVQVLAQVRVGKELPLQVMNEDMLCRAEV